MPLTPFMYLKTSPLKYLFALILSLGFSNLFAQDDDLMNMLNDDDGKSQPVIATFKTTRIINSHSTKTLAKRNLDFRITHRFGNIGGASGGGGHTLYGLDNAANIRIAFEYGLTDNIMIGVGRNKVREAIDGFVKYRFLSQTTDNKIPVSMALMLNTAVTPMVDPTGGEWTKFLHRVSYTSQLLIARKFGEVGSLQLMPTYVHRNYVPGAINTANGEGETNGLFAIGAAGRIKLGGSSSIIVDYYYTFSKYRQDNPITPYYMPLSIGYEIETGGHVFHIDFTNSAGIIENDFIPSSTDNWAKGGFKFGFNISRVFTLGGKKKK